MQTRNPNTTEPHSNTNSGRIEGSDPAVREKKTDNTHSNTNSGRVGDPEPAATKDLRTEAAITAAVAALQTA